MIKALWIQNSFLGLALIGLSACATSGKNAGEVMPPKEPVAPQSTISINYSLRHNIYLFQLQSVNDSQFTAKSKVNEKVIEDRRIPKDKYISFANRIYDFAAKYKNVAPAADCKAPFSIRMEKDGQVSEVKGCRSNDESGELGKIIREGEILFYTQE